MTPAERRALIQAFARALGIALDDEDLETPEEIARVVVDELAKTYDITPKKRN